MAEKTKAERLLAERLKEQAKAKPEKELTEVEKLKKDLKAARQKIKDLKNEKEILVAELDKYIAAYNDAQRKLKAQQTPTQTAAHQAQQR